MVIDMSEADAASPRDAVAVDVIVRFHDPDRFEELRAALLSLIGQVHRPLRVIIVTQRFSAATHAQLDERLRPYRALDPSVTLDVVPYSRRDGLRDARAALVNAGIAAAQGRYLAVLDYDDTLYPHAYEVLLRALRAGDAAVAFAGIALKSVAIFPSVPLGIAYARKARAPGQGLLDTLRASFTPFHGILFDRTRIAADDLRLDESLTIEEDYDLLLRLAVRYPFSYEALWHIVGDYRYKDDGSNTVLLPGNMDAGRIALWEQAAARTEELRRTLQVDPDIQARLGIDPPRPGLTIRNLLDQIDSGQFVPRHARLFPTQFKANAPCNATP